MSKPLPINGKHTIPAVNKAIELLRLLTEEEGQTTTKALSLRLGLPRTTCYRILRSLIAKDWVRAVGGGGHQLSLGLLPLLQPLRPVEQLADLLQPILQSLAARTGLTAKASVRQGDYAVTVARCESPRATSIAVRLGASFHLAFGSSGAVLLSGLDEGEVKRILDRAPEECWAYQKPREVNARLKELAVQGWCADMGTFRPSCHAVSVPLHDAGDSVVASLTIVGFPHELPPQQSAQAARMLLDAARQARKELRKLSSHDAPRLSKSANGKRVMQ